MTERTRRIENLALAGGLILVLAATAAVRLRLLDFPLERDEGEYAYVGRQLLHGEPPYRLAYTMKLPGTHAAYALTMALLGEKLAALRTGLLLVNLTSIALVFALGRRWIGGWGGLVAATTYAVLSTSSTTLGQAGHATHFVVLFVLGGLLLAPPEPGEAQRARWILSGLSFGLGVLMKQAGLAFVALALVLPHLRRPERGPALRASLLLGSGAALPLLLVLAVLASSGVFDDFWTWTVSYAWQYAGAPTAAAALANLKAALGAVVLPAWPLWALAAAGLAVIGLGRTLATGHLLLTWLSLASALALLPGFQFRRHYFILALPAVALLSGVAVTTAARRSLRALAARPRAALAALLFLASVGFTVHADRDFLLLSPPDELCRALYGPNPFPEADEIARFVEARSEPGDRIAVFGSEPEILFLGRRPSATGFLYVYPLMEPQSLAADMQRQMAAEVQAARPEFLIFVNVPTSWLVRPESDTWILDWMQAYCDREYRLVGAVEILSAERTRFVWEQAVASFEPATPDFVLVFQRRE